VFKARMGTGFDAVFDATGAIPAMNQAVGYCRNGGALTLVGVVKGTLAWEDPEIHRRELTIRASRNATREDFDHVMASIRNGDVPTDRLATHATSLDDVPVNLPKWAHERNGLIKAIITV
jgi:threonine dehydrogenase-like Zn-dependent dehydrogenase